MNLVIVESPFSGDVAENISYARACVRECIMAGESPLASHLLYTQPGILDDNIAWQRVKGINAGLAWYKHADKCVVYVDRGISKGMQAGIDFAQSLGIPVEFRRLGVVNQ